MPFQHGVWRVGLPPRPLVPSPLASELMLEDMIVAAPGMLSDQWLLIGRQVKTGFGGFIDLLAVAPDGSLILIELKKDRTPREVVAQAIDYASWVEDLDTSELVRIYDRFAPGRELLVSLQDRFGADFDEDSLNSSHQIVIVAARLDDSTERIVRYLGERLPINVLFFQTFNDGDAQYLSRVWLNDPAETQSAAASGSSTESREPWNGEFYVSFGDGPDRPWEEALRYGFISAGGGAWYSQTLSQLAPGDRVWVKIPGKGYVGVGRVTGERQQLSEFTITVDGHPKPAVDVLEAAFHRENIEDPDTTEWFVPVDWIEAVPRDRAFNEVGLFGNQNSVCKPTAAKWRHTIDRLKQHFRNYDT